MKPLTIVADPCTGLPYESRILYRDPVYAFETRNREGFRHLQPATREIKLPTGSTVGEEVAWMMPGEALIYDGLIVEVTG